MGAVWLLYKLHRLMGCAGNLRSPSLLTGDLGYNGKIDE